MMKIFAFVNRLFPKGSAVRHVLILAGGTTLAQVVNVLVSPLLSRIYGPSDFGILALYSSILAICGSFTALRYHMAIPLHKERRVVVNVVSLSVGLQIILGTALTVLVFAKGDTLAFLFHVKELKPYIWFLPLGFMSSGLYQILSYWALKEKAFFQLSRSRFMQSIAGVSTSVVLGFLGIRPLGLLAAHLVHQSGGAFYLAMHMTGRKGKDRPSLIGMKTVARRYRRFPLFSVGSDLANTLGFQITPILLVSFFGTQVAGWFAFSVRLLQMPMIIVGQAIGQVFFQRASEAIHDNRLSDIAFRVYLTLLMLGTFPIVCLALLAPGLFGFVFGRRWMMAGVYVRYLAPWLLMMFCSSPLTPLFALLERQKEGLVLRLIMFFGYAGSLCLGNLLGDAIFTIKIYAFSAFILRFLFLLRLMRLSGNAIGKTLAAQARELAYCLPLAFLFVIAKILAVHETAILFLLAVSGGVFLYLRLDEIRRMLSGR